MIVIDTNNVLDQALRLSTVAFHNCKPEAESRTCLQPFDADEQQVEIPGTAGDVTDAPWMLATDAGLSRAAGITCA